MNFLTDGIGDIVLEKLAQAREVRMAVAYFSPNDPLMIALLAVPGLRLIISEEYTLNDPYKLEQLAKAKLRSIPTDHEKGKLHAKVIIAKLRDGSSWVLLGSANLTRQGMFVNQEACIELHSFNAEDQSALGSIQQWFHLLFKRGRILDLKLAKSIFDNRSRYRLEPRPATESTDYWALKTTAGGPSHEDHWQKMLAEGIIAIGWEELSINPSQVSDAQLRTALRAGYAYSSRQAHSAASTIRDFVGLKEGTILVLCQGYAPNQDKPVHIYGFARVTGPFRASRRKGTEWRFTHTAIIQEVNAQLPKKTIEATLKKGSLRQTLHGLTEASVTRLAKELGVPIEV
jgi:hypothetical protein